MLKAAGKVFGGFWGGALALGTIVALPVFLAFQGADKNDDGRVSPDEIGDILYDSGKGAAEYSRDVGNRVLERVGEDVDISNDWGKSIDDMSKMEACELATDPQYELNQDLINKCLEDEGAQP